MIVPPMARCLPPLGLGLVGPAHQLSLPFVAFPLRFHCMSVPSNRPVDDM